MIQQLPHVLLNLRPHRPGQHADTQEHGWLGGTGGTPEGRGGEGRGGEGRGGEGEGRGGGGEGRGGKGRGVYTYIPGGTAVVYHININTLTLVLSVRLCVCV